MIINRWNQKIKNSRKKFSEYQLRKVPFFKDLENYIYNFHKNLGHRNGRDVKNEMIKKKYTTNCINEVINNCGICYLKKNVKIHKREKTKLLFRKNV